MPIGVAVTALGALWSIAASPVSEPAALPPVPIEVEEVPAVDVAATPAADPCADAVVQQALTAGDDAKVVAAFGGGEKFRGAVVAGNAPCISLSDPSRLWVVVNKTRALEPVDFAPQELVDIPLQVTTSSKTVRADVAAAVGALGQASFDGGAGRLGANNGYRSHGLQVTTYEEHVREQGQAAADAASARPGFSEHQTGLALDVVACAARCGGIDTFGTTTQSDWVAEHAWEHGFIVRYEQVGAATTGYEPEPWHLRYVGAELAAAYHRGGFHTLEEFFALPAAPAYAN